MRVTLLDRAHRAGPAAALASALLFGASTPVAKGLLQAVDPWLLAGLLYAGSGLGMMLLYRLRRPARAQGIGSRRHLAALLGVIVFGGALAPALLMYGLAAASASGVSLLLNAEAVFTALLAWFVFRESVDARIALGFVAIVAGALVLAWPDSRSTLDIAPVSAVLAACLAWAIDNNLTRQLSLLDERFIASVKGCAAGTTNILMALAMGAKLPAWPLTAATMVIGWVCYGLSLALFVTALRQLGAARTSAYFSVAPFFGAALSIVFLGEALTATVIIAGVLMAIGVWLHVTEDHRHLHAHEALEHTHEHEHDEHHRHDHDQPSREVRGRHSHWHRHEPLEHSHRHYPDSHHQHPH